MARLNTIRSSTRASTVDSLYRDPTPVEDRPARNAALSPSPAGSFSSDKENHGDATPRAQATDNGKGKRPMAPPTVPSASTSARSSNKRRRLTEQGSSTTGSRAEVVTDEDKAKKWYDPKQDIEERREVRKGIRENTRNLHDCADQYLKGDDTSFIELIKRQDGYMDRVKQTTDATLDARFLVNAADLAHKKAERMTYGDSSAVGVDMDEFVSKCISFMKNGRPLGQNEDEPISTQARRNRRQTGVDSDDEGDDGDAMAWHILGERACFPNNKRPAIPSFLLGPLSVQKKIVKAKTRLAKEKVTAVVSKPQSLGKEDLETGESSNLMNQCAKIRSRLIDVIADGEKAIEREVQDAETEEEAREIIHRHRLATNYEVPLFHFAINPDSFGQTVENLFYISFLIKDGLVKLVCDEESEGFPTLRPIDKKTIQEQHDTNAARHQAIFSIEYATWQKIIEAESITAPLIPHRKDEEATQVNARGWYG